MTILPRAVRKALAWRPAWFLRLAVRYSLTEAESLRAHRRVVEHNVYIARAQLEQQELELRKVDYAIRENDRNARDGSMELAKRRAA